MNDTLRHIVLCTMLTSCSHLVAISMVYSFRIAQITKPIPDAQQRNKIATILLFDQNRIKYDQIRQNYVGSLASFIYDFDTNYLRIDGALGHIHEKEHGTTTVSDTETDDILFTLGHNVAVTKNSASISFSGLFGIPTHRIYRLQHSDFGYNQVGLGVQIDGLYQVTDKSRLLYGGRYLYFIPRDALDPRCCRHRFTIGNVGDLLLAYEHDWHSEHWLECGYTFRSRFGCHCFPRFDQIVERTNYVRSNFYIVYSYNFMIDRVQNRFYAYLSYGFDHQPKTFGNKDIVTEWVAWQISF